MQQLHAPGRPGTSPGSHLGHWRPFPRASPKSLGLSALRMGEQVDSGPALSGGGHAEALTPTSPGDSKRTSGGQPPVLPGLEHQDHPDGVLPVGGPSQVLGPALPDRGRVEDPLLS